jgi:Xaa-Pro aminopeptidase
MNLFSQNRRHLIEKLSGGIIILSAYSGMQRSNDMAYGFEQEANFWWLTGIEAADWWIIIDGTRAKTWLVAPSVSDAHMIFDGTLSPEVAIKISDVDAVLSPDEAASKLHELAKKHSVVYTLGDPPHAEYLDFTLNPAPKKLHDQLSRTFNSVHDCRKEIAQLRSIKQPEEIARIKKAVNLTVEAFKQTRETLDGMTHEYAVEAEFTHYFRSRGARGHAYDPIVAAGKNACTLHYIQNDTKLKKRELLLLDIGARHHGYAADITRTYAYGEPTKREQAVHRAVQVAQKEIIALLVPNLPLEQYQREVDKIMTDTLLSLGLMHDKADRDAYHKYFPHAISHGLGVDVHDSMGGPRFLQPGMVLTVEPGIYIPEEGIGVRIEDDILITDAGHNNLSGHLSTDL